VAQFLDEHWKSTKIVSRGQSYYGHLLPGFVASIPDDETGAEEPIGLLLYRQEDSECEVMTLDSIQRKSGVGTALLEAMKQYALENGIRRLWLITTNDNLDALRFYQKRGWHLVTIHRDALNESRRLKPQIPIIGLDGIPLRDEIELELTL
jgi:DNA-3-methyladenine glycosylase I